MQQAVRAESEKVEVTVTDHVLGKVTKIQEWSQEIKREGKNSISKEKIKKVY